MIHLKDTFFICYLSFLVGFYLPNVYNQTKHISLCMIGNILLMNNQFFIKSFFLTA